MGDDVDLNNLAHMIAKEMLDKHLTNDAGVGAQYMQQMVDNSVPEDLEEDDMQSTSD